MKQNADPQIYMAKICLTDFYKGEKQLIEGMIVFPTNNAEAIGPP